MFRPAAALALAALAALPPSAALADQRSYAHVHQPAPQPAIDPATAAVIELGVEILEEIVRQRKIEERERCYDKWGYYIC